MQPKCGFVRAFVDEYVSLPYFFKTKLSVGCWSISPLNYRGEGLIDQHLADGNVRAFHQEEIRLDENYVTRSFVIIATAACIGIIVEVGATPKDSTCLIHRWQHPAISVSAPPLPCHDAALERPEPHLPPSPRLSVRKNKQQPQLSYLHHQLSRRLHHLPIGVVRSVPQPAGCASPLSPRSEQRHRPR